jgi:hypothetical protein
MIPVKIMTTNTTTGNGARVLDSGIIHLVTTTFIWDTPHGIRDIIPGIHTGTTHGIMAIMIATHFTTRGFAERRLLAGHTGTTDTGQVITAVTMVTTVATTHMGTC